MHKIVALGDKAVLVEFAETLDLALNLRVQRLAKALEERRAPWLRDVVPALASLALHFDRTRLPRGATPAALAASLIDACLAAPLPDLDALTREVELPVCYDERFAPDLHEVAARCGLTSAEVAARHAASAHRVLMVGFVPGHPYIGGLDPAVSVPRRPTPRPRVPTGSIAIANAQTVVYPYPTPSGWSLIGRTPERLFDIGREPAALLAPGDRVRFVPIGVAEFERRLRATAQ